MKRSSIQRLQVSEILLTLTLSDGTTRLYSFAEVPDIRAGLALLPAVLGDALKVRIVWDSRSKKFVARR